MADLGASSVELDTRIPEWRFDEVVGAVRNHGLSLTSVEAVCPHPADLSRHVARPGLVPLAHADDSERRVAIRLHRRTIELAAEVSAPCVVLTLGRIAMPEGFGVAPEGERETRAYLSARALVAPPHLDAVRFSLDHLLPLAEKLERRLAIAVSADLAAFPSFQELRVLVDGFRGAPLGVWLDTRALWALEHGGIRRVETWAAFGESTFGIRVGDLRDAAEVVPGEGGINLAALRKALALPEAVARVLDLGATHDHGRIRECVQPKRLEAWP